MASDPARQISSRNIPQQNGETQDTRVSVLMMVLLIHIAVDNKLPQHCNCFGYQSGW